MTKKNAFSFVLSMLFCNFTRQIEKCMETKGLSYLGLLLFMLTFIACEKEKFDANAYNEIVDYQFLIDNVDRNHEWCLTHGDTITITNSGESIYAVQVLTNNPYTATNAEIAAEGVCFLNGNMDGGHSTTLAYTLPIVQDRAYIAALKQDGTYIGVTPFTFGTDTVNLDYVILESGKSVHTPQPQTFTYLYEEGFPLPGDFDFNDLVLRVSKSITELSYQVDLKVTVEAVGGNYSFAGAILLAGISYDDVDKVEILEGENMDKGYPLRHTMIDNDKTLLRSRSGEPVIRLFESGHYVLNNQLNEVGSVQTLFYNTETTPVEERSAIVPSVSRTYRISFKNRNIARSLSFDQIDPFITHEYNGGLWEIHTYKYKFQETLRSIYNGKSDFYDNHISWSIVVPKADFRYAVESMSLGTFNSHTGVTFGPYTSFAEWMTDHTQNNDWYEHITYPQLLY